MATHLRSVHKPNVSKRPKSTSFSCSKFSCDEIFPTLNNHRNDDHPHIKTASVVKVPSIVEENTSFYKDKQNHLNEQIQNNDIHVCECLASKIKSHVIAVKIDFTPNSVDDENYEKCQNLLKQLSERFNVENKTEQVLPIETVIAGLENDLNAGIDFTFPSDDEGSCATADKKSNEFKSIVGSYASGSNSISLDI